MEFVNIKRNILAIIGKQWQHTDSLGPFSLRPIQEEFTDIPHRELVKHIQSLEHNGYLKLSDDGRKAQLTPKGLNQLKVVTVANNHERIMVVDKLR